MDMGRRTPILRALIQTAQVLMIQAHVAAASEHARRPALSDRCGGFLLCVWFNSQNVYNVSPIQLYTVASLARMHVIN